MNRPFAVPDGEAAGQLGVDPSPGQLQQRQRVPPGLGDDPVANPVVRPTKIQAVSRACASWPVSPLKGTSRQAGK